MKRRWISCARENAGCNQTDRLARSTAHLLSIIELLEGKGVAFRVLDFGGGAMDTRSPHGKLLLPVFAGMAQFEREIMPQRQREGIAAAKAAGKYRGRKATAQAKASEVRALSANGVGATNIAARLGIGRASVYRILANEASR